MSKESFKNILKQKYTDKKSKPKNKKLYNEVKTAAKRKFDVYPSAYANSWLVRQYKKKGGKYE
jgi:hypothetical protein